MLLPVRRRTGPSMDNFLLGLHEPKYSLPSRSGRILAFDRLALLRFEPLKPQYYLNLRLSIINSHMNSRFNLGLHPHDRLKELSFQPQSRRNRRKCLRFSRTVSPSKRCLCPLRLLFFSLCAPFAQRAKFSPLSFQSLAHSFSLFAEETHHLASFQSLPHPLHVYRGMASSKISPPS